MDPNEIIHQMSDKIEYYLSMSNAKINKSREELIQSQRIIILDNLLRPKLSKYTKLQVHDIDSFIFRPTILSSFLGLSQLSQNTSFLFSYIHQHPDLFALAVISMSKHKCFNYLIRSAIPALYGYFSAKEYLDLGFVFYARIVEEATPKITMKIVMPFLHNAIVFRYFEVLINNFLNSFVIDLKAEQISDGYLPVLSESFVSYMTNYFNLLPEHVLQLLRLVKDKNWGNKYLYTLLFDNFFWDGTYRYLNMINLDAHKSLFEKMFVMISKRNDLVQLILDSLFNSRSVYNVPLLYHSFGQNYLDFFLCVHDVQVISDTLVHSKILPDMVSLDDFEQIPSKYETSCYFCQLFPRFKFIEISNLSLTLNYSLFDIKEQSQETKSLEKFLFQKLLKSEISKWKKIVLNYEIRILLPYIQNVTWRYAKAKEISPKDFISIFQKMVRYFNKSYLNKYIYISLLSQVYKKWIGQYSQVLNDSDLYWKDIISERKDIPHFATFATNLPLSLQPILFEGVNLFSYRDDLQLIEKFFYITKGLHQINIIVKHQKESKKIFSLLFKQIKTKDFFSTFCIQDCFAFQRKAFQEILSKDELNNWKELKENIQANLNREKHIQVYNSIMKYLYDLLPSNE